MNNSNSSVSNVYCKYDVEDKYIGNIIKIAALALLSAFGILGNIFIIVLAVKYTVRKNLHHLIINMAVADALFISLNIIDKIPYELNNPALYDLNGTLGVIFCKSIIFAVLISCNVSLITLLVISIERFRATRPTLQISRPYKMKQRLAVLSACWVIPMATNVYPLYFSNIWSGLCLSNNFYSSPLKTMIYRSVQSGSYALSFILSCVTFSLSIVTMRRLSRPQAIHAHLNQEQRNIRANRTKAAVRMVLASVILQACCWLPFYILYAMLDTSLMPSVKKYVCIDWNSLYFVTAYFLPPFNSAFSPCIYIIFLPDFKEAAKKLMCSEINIQVARANMSIPLKQRSPNRQRNIKEENDEDNDDEN